MRILGRDVTIKKLFQWSLYPLAVVINSIEFLSYDGLSFKQRAYLLIKYLYIQFRPNLKCGHKFGDLIHISIKAIELYKKGKRNGIIAECGCWEGAASAKLSTLAKMLGWELYIFDSFEGLPDPSSSDDPLFKKGMYSSMLEKVRGNIGKYGHLENVSFFKGWFEDSLAEYKGKNFDIVFVDADLESSIKTCIKYILPKLNKDGYIFFHEAHLSSTTEIFTDASWWKSNLNCQPRPLIGAGTGLGLGKEWLGYIRN